MPPDATKVARYYGSGDELHLAFNFAFTFVPWSAPAFRAAIDAFMEGVTLEEKAKKHAELREALGKWGHARPK